MLYQLSYSRVVKQKYVGKINFQESNVLGMYSRSRRAGVRRPLSLITTFTYAQVHMKRIKMRIEALLTYTLVNYVMAPSS